jgi:hypothetical protein
MQASHGWPSNGSTNAVQKQKQYLHTQHVGASTGTSCDLPELAPEVACENVRPGRCRSLRQPQRPQGVSGSPALIIAACCASNCILGIIVANQSAAFLGSALSRILRADSKASSSFARGAVWKLSSIHRMMVNGALASCSLTVNVISPADPRLLKAALIARPSFIPQRHAVEVVCHRFSLVDYAGSTWAR